MENRLKEIRWEKGWTEGDLQRRSGVARSTICEIENGVNKHPSVDVAVKLSRALKVSVEEIFYFKD